MVRCKRVGMSRPLAVNPLCGLPFTLSTPSHLDTGCSKSTTVVPARALPVPTFLANCAANSIIYYRQPYVNPGIAIALALDTGGMRLRRSHHILPEAKSLLHGTHHADMPEGYSKFR